VTVAHGQTAQTNDELKKFIPKGFTEETSVSGDINADGIADKILILSVDRQSYDSAALSKILPDTFKQNDNLRPLLLLVRQRDSSLKQIARNDFVIEWSGIWVGGLPDPDPFTGDIKINNGQFSLDFQYKGGGEICTVTVTFVYSKKESNWFLNEVSNDCASSSYDNEYGGYGKPTSSIKKTTKDFGKIKFTDYKGFDKILNN
jgi:hypothetical protein